MIIAALSAPALAEVPPDRAVAGPVEESVSIDSGTVVADRQLAAAEQMSSQSADGVDAGDPVARPSKAQFSPIGEAVLNLLRSQGGGHLRP